MAALPGRWRLSFYMMAVLTFAALILSHLVRTSKFGLGLQAIRENEDAAEVMGVVAPDAKTWAYVYSAIVPGMVGVLFFFKNGNVEPHVAFPLHASIELLVMVMLGGQGTVLGPILGALAYQGMRGYFVTSDFFKDIQLSVSGVLLLLIVLFIPAGAIGWLRRRFPTAKEGTGMTVFLSVQGVTKRFGGLQALTNVTFDLPEGQILGLIGPNGAGKTTLFNAINGVYPPEEGRVIFRDKDVTNAKTYHHARMGMARTHQIVQP